MFYPNRFAAKPDSVEVFYSKGNVRYQPSGDKTSTGQVVKDDNYGPSEVIETGPGGFVGLVLPSGDVISVTSERRFSLEQLRCLPNDGNCAVLIDEEYGRIYLNVKSRNGHPARSMVAKPINEAAVLSPFLYFEVTLEPSGREWPVLMHRPVLLLGNTTGTAAITGDIFSGVLDQLSDSIDQD